MSKLQVVVSGPHGRMGQAICRLADAADDLDLCAGLVAENRPTGTENGVRLPRTASSLAEIVSGAARPLVMIDFTAPAATLVRLREGAELGVPVVVGTTGFSADQHAEIETLAAQIPILLSANMSVGVNVLLGIVEKLAATLSTYDIEVIETHHRLKKDSPSGTALALAKAAAAGRQVDLDDVARHGREGMVGERTAAEIGIHAIRGGDVVGDHTVLFAGTGERVEITHKATSRDAFASGALAAARYLADRKPGLYTMKDALQLG